jgi:hypothetical protein
MLRQSTVFISVVRPGISFRSLVLHRLLYMRRNFHDSAERLSVVSAVVNILMLRCSSQSMPSIQLTSVRRGRSELVPQLLSQQPNFKSSLM